MQTNKIPRSWQLRASYLKTADGRMIARPLHARMLDMNSHMTSGHAPAATVARRPRRAASAPLLSRQRESAAASSAHTRRESSSYTTQNRPVSAIPKNSFLVTQIEMEDMLLSAEADDLFMNTLNDGDSSALMTSENLTTQYKQRPLSAAVGSAHVGIQQLDLSSGSSRPRSSVAPRTSPQTLTTTFLR